MRGDRFWRLARPTLGPLIMTLFRVRAEGVEHVPASGPALLVSNHQSWLDIPVLGAAQPRPVRYMAKSELWEIPGVGRVIETGGGFPVRRGQADRAAVRAVHDLLEGGAVIGIFIEGHRNPELAEAKVGAGRFAVVEAVPVVPVAITGTRGWRPGRRVRVRFGPARRYERGDRRPNVAYRETAQELLDAIRALLG